MIIRRLTADEKAAAQKARNEANTRIKALRVKRVDELKARYTRKDDRERMAVKELPMLAGLPATITDGVHTVTVDYDDLYHFTRKFRSSWEVTMHMVSSRGKVELAITYRHQKDPRRNGMARLYGLQDVHLRALEGLELPVVQLTGPDPKRQEVAS